jgi:hypothetical protein
MRTALIRSMARTQIVAAEIRRVLVECEDSRVPTLMNALGEIEVCRTSTVAALRESANLEDEPTEHAIQQILAQTERVLDLARLAIQTAYSAAL